MDIDSLVKTYLQKKGYTQAAAELEAAIMDKRNEDASDHRNEDSEVIDTMKNSLSQDLILFGLASDENYGKASLFLAEYSKLRYWIFSSIDIIRRELVAICFPIFAHVYISLIQRESLSEAYDFMKKWSGDYIDEFKEEISCLVLLSSRHQLSSSDFLETNMYINAIVKGKFLVKARPLVKGLLISFLNQNNMLLTLSIINERLQILEVEQSPNAALQAIELKHMCTPSNSIVSPVATGIDGVVVDNTEIYTGMFGRAAGANTGVPPPLFWKDTAGEFRYDPYYAELFNKIIRRDLLLQYDFKFDDPSLLVWPDVDRGLDISNEGSCSKSNEFSVLYATITNTYDTMTCMSITPDASQFACGFNDSCIRVWSTKPVDSEYTVETGMSHILPKAKEYAYSHATSVSERKDNIENDDVTHHCSELRGHCKPVYSISQQVSGRLLLSTSADETVRLWDTRISQCISLYATIGPSWDVEFGPLGHYFAIANQNRTAAIYSTDQASPLRVFVGHSSDVNTCKWHPNGSYLLTGSDDKTARLWDVRAGPCVRIFKNCLSQINTVAFSSNGDIVAAGCESGVIVLWDIMTGKRTAVLESHIGPINAIVFSPNDKYLCSGGDDCTVRLWDVSSSSKGEDEVISHADQTFHTKYSSVYTVSFQSQNVLLAGGAFSLRNSSVQKISKRESSSEADSMNALGAILLTCLK